MTEERSLVFKTASDPSEFEKVFRLNYRTFVEEIPQHPPNPEHRLVDRFHHQNVYLIALEGDELIGMMAVRDQRPFSLDEKLGNIDPYLPSGRKLCEIRLLSVIPTHRKGTVLQGLLKLFVGYSRTKGYSLGVISGTVRQLKLYKHLGFVPFGPLVGPPEAQYQPMYLTLESFERNARPVVDGPADRTLNPVSFLPGPVSIRREVREALEKLPFSHRSDRFREEMTRARARLCELVVARRVELLLGSGTLANEVVAGQLSLTAEPGVVLSNGEFGHRLFDHARRWKLPAQALNLDWGAVFEPDRVRAFLDANPSARWLWATSCETSTGILNDVDLLKALCAERGMKLCLDCISAIGVVPVDLRGVFLASGASGKGLGSYPGLSMVFYHHEVAPQPDRLPRYLDLGYYAANEGVPFTQSSNLLSALLVALRRFDSLLPFAETEELSDWLKPRLRELGLQILAPDAHASPAVLTLVLPESVSSQAMGDALQSAGFLLSYQSEYLRHRNWIQVCVMGDCSRASLLALLRELRRLAPIPVATPA
jgi:aspartate aminotransferase-like enzyme